MIDSVLGVVSSSCTVVNVSLLPWTSCKSSESPDCVDGDRVVSASVAAEEDSVVAFVSRPSPDKMSASERVRPGLTTGVDGATVVLVVKFGLLGALMGLVRAAIAAEGIRGFLGLVRSCVLLIFGVGAPDVRGSSLVVPLGADTVGLTLVLDIVFLLPPVVVAVSAGTAVVLASMTGSLSTDSFSAPSSPPSSAFS